MKLIKLTNNHYIIVDDSEIKFGDWYYKQNLNIITKKHYSSPEGDVDLKITHSNVPMEGVVPLDISEVKELIGEVDVESLAEYKTNVRILQHKTPSRIARQYFDGYFDGYNQAIEDNKEKKYTGQEVFDLMCKAFEQGFKKADVVDAGLEGKETDAECAWILKVHGRPKTEWEVEFIDNKLKLV